MVTSPLSKTLPVYDMGDLATISFNSSRQPVPRNFSGDVALLNVLHRKG
jgi:hypothetical protein